LARDEHCADAISAFTTKAANGRIPHALADYLATTTLDALQKKDTADIETLRRNTDKAFDQPSRPLPNSCILVKLACDCTRIAIKINIVAIRGPGQLAVGCKGGCESLLLALQLALFGDAWLVARCMDKVNGFNEREHDAMRASITAQIRVHKLLPLFYILYKGREKELWLYDEQGDLYHTYYSCRGVR
jgi:hypothetical protein